MKRIVSIFAITQILLCVFWCYVNAEKSVQTVDISDIVIVRGDLPIWQYNGSVDGWRDNYAAQELSKYLSQMGGLRVPVVTFDAIPQGKCAILIGNKSENPIVNKLIEDGTTSIDIPNSNSDGFVVKSVKSKDGDYLILAGESSISTLYSVYDYLERFCNVGFFLDGENVPKSNKVPFFGINFSSKPRFESRGFNMTSSPAIKKYHHMLWSADDWKNRYSWFAKRKLNFSNLNCGYHNRLSGIATLIALGADSEPADEHYNFGWPDSWYYPAKRSTQVTQESVKFARDMGLKLFMVVGFGNVPYWYKKMHPEYKWVEGIYDMALLHPDDPISIDITKKLYFYNTAFFGTDHIYFDYPYAEQTGTGTIDESLRVRIESAKKAITTLKDIDPQAKLMLDTWDFACFPESLWKVDNVKKYLETFKNDNFAMIYDTQAEAWDKSYKRNGYFFGKDWTFGVLLSFQGDDQLFGDLNGLINKVNEAVDDPQSTNLKGMIAVPETSGHNVLYWQLMTELTWDPSGITKENFLKDYCVKRYGKESLPAMEKSIKILADTLYSGGGFYQMIYKKIGSNYNTVYVIVDDNKQHVQDFLDKEPKVITNLKKCLDIALSQSDKLKENKLFENDMVDIAKCYWGHKSNLYLINAYQAFGNGDKDGFEKNFSAAIDMLNRSEKLLSTRKDYQLQIQIDEVESYPGHNPYSAKMIKQASRNQDYACNDVYEMFHYYYIPKVKAWGDVLRSKMEKGEKTVTLKEVDPAYKPVIDSFLNNPIRISDDQKLKCTPIEAVKILQD